MICDNCGTPIRRKVYYHFNVAQMLSVHYFCSDDCKERWCFDIANNKSNLSLQWAISSNNYEYFFLLKRGFSFGNKAITRFSPDINNIESLNVILNLLLEKEKQKQEV